MRRVGTELNDNFYFLPFSSFSNLFWPEMNPQWYFFIFLNFFLIFMEFSITHRVGMKRNDNFYFGLKWSNNGIFLIFLIFWLFFGIFLYALGRNGTEWNDNFYFRSFSDFSSLKAWNEAIMVSFNFLNFFSIFLEFCIMRRVRTKWNENFYFLCFSSFSNLLRIG